MSKMILATVFVIFFLASSSATRFAVPELPECLTKCAPYVSSAVCALRNGKFKLFVDECARFLYACNNQQEWDQVHMSNCHHTICPLACPSELLPVCGSNGVITREFAGECDLINHACENYNEEWKLASSC